MREFIREFKEFAVKGNVFDLAVGVIIGTAFNKIVQSLVSDIMLPPIALVLKKVNFSNLYISLNRQEYSSLAEAQAAGAPTLNYGVFIDNLISFIITAFAVFLFVRYANKLRRRADQKEEAEAKAEEKKEAETTKDCPFCRRTIHKEATRCPECTSQLA